jgi:hypothetical protein
MYDIILHIQSTEKARQILLSPKSVNVRKVDISIRINPIAAIGKWSIVDILQKISASYDYAEIEILASLM